jgi:hypothetical protein
MPANPRTFLPWDSAFFGLRIGRLAADRLTPELLNASPNWVRSHQICLYFLARSDCGETIRLAETAGFHLVAVRITLETLSFLIDGTCRAA